VLDETSSETQAELVFYEAEDGQSRVRVRLEGGTVGLSQRVMANLFQLAVLTVNEHLTSIYDEAELDATATSRKFRTERPEDFEPAEQLGPDTVKS
jgi:hypothetical protein